MKKVIIIILAVLLAVDVGVLAYGATRGPAVVFDGEAVGLKVKPAESVYKNAEDWNDIGALLSVSDPAEKAAKILVGATYNLIESTGFYASYQDKIVSGSHDSYSKNFRVVQGVNEFYQTLTSSTNYEKRQVKYYTEEILQRDFNADFDSETKKFATKLNKPSVSKVNDLSKKSKVPYTLFSWFDIPLYIGAKGSDVLVTNVIDGSTVNVEENGDIYVLTFKAVVSKANEAETTGLLSSSLGDSKINSISEISVEANIWKCGLFKDMTVDVAFNGEVNNTPGDATLQKTLEFSYAKQDASIVYWIKALDWEKFVGKKVADNFTKYEEELAALTK